MNKKVKLIVNIIATILYGVAFFSFFTDYVYVWILGIGNMGGYKGYEIAFNFDGMPGNLGALIPLLLNLGVFGYGLFIIIKDLITWKRPSKNKKGHPLVSAIVFALLPIAAFFCILSTSSILNLPSPKRYGGYYMGISVYLNAYFTLIGGLMFFITESGIFAKNDEVQTPVVETANKVEAPKAATKVEPAKEVKLEEKKEEKPAPKVAAKPTRAPIKLRCKRCGEIFLSNEKKCPKCGADVNPTNMVKLVPTSQVNKTPVNKK